MKSAALQAIEDGQMRAAVVAGPLRDQRTLLATPLPTVRALSDIARERARQEELFVAGEISIHVSDPNTHGRDSYIVLSEEHGEVAEALQRPGRLTAAWRQHLRTELVQLAAVATAWIEAIDSAERASANQQSTINNQQSAMP